MLFFFYIWLPQASIGWNCSHLSNSRTVSRIRKRPAETESTEWWAVNGWVFSWFSILRFALYLNLSCFFLRRHSYLLLECDSLPVSTLRCLNMRFLSFFSPIDITKLQKLLFLAPHFLAFQLQFKQKACEKKKSRRNNSECARAHKSRLHATFVTDLFLWVPLAAGPGWIIA